MNLHDDPFHIYSVTEVFGVHQAQDDDYRQTGSQSAK